MTDQNNPPAITPERLQEWLNTLEDAINREEQSQSRVVRHRKKDTQDVFVEMSMHADHIANYALKLHEENTRLSNLLKAAEITEHDNMQLREGIASLKNENRYLDECLKQRGCKNHWSTLHEENARLQECLRFYADGYGGAFGHVAREALKEQSK